MNPRLKALLGLIGAASIGVGGVLVNVYLPKPGVTRADLLDAGITADCNQIAVFCDAELSLEGRSILRDSGLDAGARKRFAHIGMPGLRCGSRQDGGLILPPALRALHESGQVRLLSLDDCDMGSCAANPEVCDASVFGNRTPFVVRPPTHVKAPMDGGTRCRRREPLRDGGTVTRYFGAGNVFPASEAVGSDCVPAANAFDGDPE